MHSDLSGSNIADRVPIRRIHCQKNIFELLFLALSANETFGNRVFWRNSRVLAKAVESLTFGQQREKTMFLAPYHDDKLKPQN